MLPGLRPPHLDYFRLFYADTAMFGGRSGLLAALDFFGPGRLVFATDAPLGPIRESVAALDRLALSDTERAGVMGGTADGCSGIRPRADRGVWSRRVEPRASW